MHKSLLLTAVLATFVVPSITMADEVAKPAEPASPHTFTYNIGLYSQYVFRGLTQTDRKPAIQGGMDYSHSSGFYAGTWASNISWLEDGGNFHSSSLEWDVYGGFRNTIGETGIGYDIGLLNYIYPGSKTNAASGTNFADPYTLEGYAALSYQWLQAKVSYAFTDTFGVKNSDGTYYAELNANYPIGETGLTVNAHVGRQVFDGKSNTVVSGPIDNDNFYSYTDYKLGLTKSWSNGVNLGAYYTDTTAKDKGYTINNRNIGDNTFTVFVQKTF